MKKITAMFAAWVLLVFPAAAGAQGITVSTTETEIRITVDVGAEGAGAPVGLELVKPQTDLGSIAGTEVPAELTAVLDYVGQEPADASGVASFVIVPNATAAGYYTAYASSKNSMVFTASFPFAPAAAVEALIASLSAEGATVADAEAVFEAPANPEELAGYEILGLSTLPAYTIFTEDTYGGDAKRARVCTEWLAAIKGQNYNKEQVGAAFEDAVYRSVIYTLEDPAKMVTYLEAYKTETGFDSAELYSTVYSDAAYFSAQAKESMAEKLIAYPWQSESKADIVKVIDEMILITATASVSDGYGKIGELITLGQNVLTRCGADFTHYATSTQSSVWRSVAGQETMAGFVTALNTAIATYQQGSTQTGTAPSGSGSSSRGDRGSSVSIIGSPASANLTTNETQPAFTDLGDAAWAEEAISDLYKKGILAGKEPGLFYPHDSMKRSEFLKVLMLALDLVDEEAAADFTDVPPESWYYPYVASAYALGIVNGYGDTFRPDATITREDAATMISRCMGVVDKELPLLREDVGFADFELISEYARNPVSTLYKAGVISGMSETEFSPKAPITRAQAAKMIYGLLTAIA